MGEKSLYRKLFFIFNQEDSGFGAGHDPSGYVKIETRDGTGKLSAVVQNLKDDPKSIIYKLYILKSGQRDFIPVQIGVIPYGKGKGELQWEFSAENIANKGITVDDINTAVVIAEYADRRNYSVICPLAAYKDTKTQWREKLKEALYLQKEIQPESEKKEVQPKAADAEKENQVMKSEESIGKSDELPTNQESFKSEDNFGNTFTPNTQNMETNSSYQEYKDMLERQGHHYTMKSSDINMPCGKPGCGYMNGTNGINPCANCFMRKNTVENADPNIQGDVERLRNDLDRCFELCDPFRSRRRDYKWWKVNSPVHLNNVLYQCNIKTPVLFNPKILMSHFKYRHLIFGIYTDTVRQKEYVVFGVPGVYSVDDRPFKDICRWAQVEGNKPRYGAFGYWLVYIDPKTGKIV